MNTSFISVISLVAASQGVNLEQSNMSERLVNKQAQDCTVIINNEKRLACFDSVFNIDLTVPHKSLLPVVAAAPKVSSIASPAEVGVKKSMPKVGLVNAVPPKVKELEETKPRYKQDVLIAKFGGEQFATQEEKSTKLEQVILVIEKVSFTLRKKQVFHFTNGQVWENKGSKKLRLASGDSVLVKDGAFGAFYLSKIGKNGNVRVKRVK